MADSEIDMSKSSYIIPNLKWKVSTDISTLLQYDIYGIYM